MRADQSGSNYLSKKEIQKILKELHMKVNNQELKDLIDTYDKNKSGSIDYKEFK